MPCLEKNYWLDKACAAAFRHQYLALPYQELLRDTASRLQVSPGERWLDLGCGAGNLSALLWQQTSGQLQEIVALDCNAANEEAIARLRRRLVPQPGSEQIHFVQGNISEGLPQFSTESFDGILSGLAISYAESQDPISGKYTELAYNRLLAEMHRVLRPGGKLLFSVNVPRVRFWPILWKSLRQAFSIRNPGRALINGLRMQRYGHWLRREADRGRFHYLPISEIEARLRQIGFKEVSHQMSYAGQAYLVSARKAFEPAFHNY